ncbi:hypothetical protein Acr_02g0008650 [Actinidia rufa]|uniref:CCHC-type domain-containing protein n=1 Tax=Actinidia rufa TaxID=165716 RepID=A0A7J0E8C3_9ERIC|nr:hypothetical protein Acr_02g0008650 [Actinidia rufa]
MMNESQSAILQCKTVPKYKDLGCPTISCIIGGCKIDRAFLDLGSSVNLVPYSVYKDLGLGELKPTRVTLELADRFVKVPRGIIEDVLIQVDTVYYPVDFIVLDTQPVDCESSKRHIPVILGRPFLATANAVIHCRHGLLKLSFGNMTLETNIFTVAHDQLESKSVSFRDASIVSEESDSVLHVGHWIPTFEPLAPSVVKPVSSEEKPPISERKPLPSTLKYAFLGEGESYPVVISSSLTEGQEESLLKILKRHKKSLGWTIADLHGISPLMCTHRIYLEEESKPVRQMQRRLNPNMKEAVRGEVLKLLDAGIIYPISDSKWVSPTQVVPKKSGVTVVKNEHNELQKVEIGSYLLTGAASRWWNRKGVREPGMNWARFKVIFREKYVPRALQNAKCAEFEHLKQTGKPIVEYEAAFTNLAEYAPHLVATDEMRVRRFEDGLRYEIKRVIRPLVLPTYADVLDRAIIVEQDEMEKRKYFDSKKRQNFNNEGPSGQKRQKPESNWRNQRGQIPKCPTCGKNHSGECWRKRPDVICFYCNEVGHIRRNCPKLGTGAIVPKENQGGGNARPGGNRQGN